MPFWVPPHLFPVGSDEIESIFQKFFLSLIRTGRGRFSRCFWKNLLIFCYCAGIRILPLHLLHVWKPFCEPPHLFPVGKAVFLSSFQKIFRSLNPHLETVLSTYPAKISPTIPYSNFCGWKTTWFLKKFPHTPIPQLSKPKNEAFSETFSKNVLTPLPHVFG